MLVTAQSTVALPVGLVRVTVKVKGVLATWPSGLLASVAAIEKVWAAAVLKSRAPPPIPAKSFPLVSSTAPVATVT